MTLELAAHLLTTALRRRAAEWLPSAVTPGELATRCGGPSPGIIGRVTRAPNWHAIADACARDGVIVTYDRRARLFHLCRK